MSKESIVFLKEIHLLINETVALALSAISSDQFSSDHLLGGNLDRADVETLRTIQLNQLQQTALKKLLVATCRLSASGMLGVIDGIVMSSRYDLPDLSLINRETGEDIAKDAPLNEEFYYLLEE